MHTFKSQSERNTNTSCSSSGLREQGVSILVPPVWSNLSTNGIHQSVKTSDGMLRHMGIWLIVYLDDILFLHQSKEELIQLTPLICQLF